MMNTRYTIDFIFRDKEESVADFYKEEIGETRDYVARVIEEVRKNTAHEKNLLELKPAELTSSS